MTAKTKDKIKVFLVDDDNLLIDGIARFFLDSTSFEYYDRANNPDECLLKLEKAKDDIDIILMDVMFQNVEKDGIQLAKEIRTLYPGKHPKIAFMTISNRAIANVKQGFHGLIPKNQGIQELMEMLEHIYYDDMVYSPPTTLMDSFIRSLSLQQKRILCYSIQGMAKKLIAFKLNLSDKTVKGQSKVILSKMRQFGIDVENINHPKIHEIAAQFQLCDQSII